MRPQPSERGTAQAVETCTRCGRDWTQHGAEWREVPSMVERAPCAGCNGGGYVAPARKPLSLDCPTCGRKRALSKYEAVRGYHCRDCTALAEGPI